MRLTQIAVTVALLAAYGCQRGPDTKGDVRKALDQANMQHVEIKVDNDEHIVHLQGVVGSMAERTRAQEVADAVVGTSGRVLNELSVKGVNEGTAGDLDGDIRKNLDKMIDNDPTLKERNIDFDVVNGMVTIKGDVRTVDEKNRVGDMTKAAAGVKDVANGLRIESDGH
jgi:osmotically-inducible protein OsmY